MNGFHPNPDTEAAVARLDLAIERAELVQALSHIGDRIYTLKQRHAPPGDIDLLQRTERSLKKRLEIVRRRSGT